MAYPPGTRRDAATKLSCFCFIAAIVSLGPVSAEFIPPVYPPSTPTTLQTGPPQAPVSDPTPPAEPDYSSALQLRFNGRTFAEEEAPLERNLCRRTDWQCQMAFRIDVLVQTSADGRSGHPVWAPLCFDGVAKDASLLPIVAETVCRQAFKYLIDQKQPRVVLGETRMPFVIPKGRVSGPDKFDPAHYSHWVTIVGGAKEGTARLQDMELQVSTNPCHSNRLFALESCSFLNW